MFSQVRKFIGLGTVMILLASVQPVYAMIVNVEFQGFVDTISRPSPPSSLSSLFLPEGVINVGDRMLGRYQYEFETALYHPGYNALYAVSGSMIMEINGIQFAVPVDTVDVYLEAYASYHLSPGAFYFKESHQFFSIKQNLEATTADVNLLSIFLERIDYDQFGPNLLPNGIALPIEAVYFDLATRNGFRISKDTGDYSSRYTIFGKLTNMENVEVVPEPATMTLCGLGLIGMAGMRRIKDQIHARILGDIPEY